MMMSAPPANDDTMVMYDENHLLVQEIQREIKEVPVMIYGKGTRQSPRCGFTMKTANLFEALGVQNFVIQDILDNPEKKMLLNELLDWRTYPKIFVNGEFCGGIDAVTDMLQNGELEPLLKAALGEEFKMPVVS
ncbi:MAG: glutaredoxin domain-containing protein [Vampirovibrionales bacterium]